MKLTAGQRFRLTDENKFVYVKSGFVETYAMTRDSQSFRQMFLLELFEGDAAYPILDEFEELDVVIYAVEDCEIELVTFDEVNSKTQAQLMKKWFAGLVRLPWLRLMADRGDDVLINWRSGKIFLNAEISSEELHEEFLMNEQILTTMIGMQFEIDDAKLSKRLATRQKHKRQLLERVGKR